LRFSPRFGLIEMWPRTPNRKRAARSEHDKDQQ
jgi:hypothetical protein